MRNYYTEYETLAKVQDELDVKFNKTILQIEMQKKIPKNTCHHPLIIIAGQYYDINAKSEVLVCYCLSCDQKLIVEFSKERYIEDEENGLLSLINFSFLTEPYIRLAPDIYALNDLIDSTYHTTIKPLIQMVLEECDINDFKEFRRKISLIIGRRGKEYEPNFSSDTDDKSVFKQVHTK